MTVAEQTEIVSAIREWVDAEVIPSASELEHADAFPEALVEQMKGLGLFGVIIPEEYGGLGLDLTTYVLIQIELSRGWMSLSGVLNTHFLAAWMIQQYGTDDQRQRYLPPMAKGEVRSAYSMTEPHAGSDVQAIRTSAVRDGDDYVITGQKMWATNGLRAGLVMLLAKTDPDADPPHRGMTAFILEKEPDVAEQPGLTIPPPLKKLGYKGVESTELVFDGFRTPASSVLGGEAGVGQGFKYFMGAIELGRVNIAARGVGIAQRAFEEAITYAQEREAFGKPIAEHQAIQLKLAQMATKIEAARLLTMQAAERKDVGDRADLEAGMAKLFATETAAEVALEAMRIHGGYGYSQEFVVERLYRDAPVLILGEGSNEIQQLLIARRLLERLRRLMLRTAVCDLLGIECPIIQGPFGPWSDPQLTAAVSNAGALGSYGTALHTPDRLRASVERIRELSDRPFAINHTLRPFNEENFALTLELSPPIVSLAIGHQRGLVERVHEAGALFMQQVTTVEQATEAVSSGADVIIAQGSEAGGFGGFVSTMALVPQVVDAVGPTPVRRRRRHSRRSWPGGGDRARRAGDQHRHAISGRNRSRCSGELAAADPRRPVRGRSEGRVRRRSLPAG